MGAPLSVNDLGNLSGNFFKRYHKKIIGTLPGGHFLNQWSGVSDAARLGESFVVPVVLATEQGITFSKSSNNAFELNAAIDSEIKPAIIDSSQYAFRSRMSWQAIRRSLEVPEGSAEDVLGRISQHLRNQARRTMEISFMWGRQPRAIIESVDAGNSCYTITKASWSGAMWTLSKNMAVDVLANDYSALHRATTITKIDPFNRIIYVAEEGSGIAGDYILPKGVVEAGSPPVWHESPGLYSQLSTVSGTMFGLDYGANDVLVGNVIPCHTAGVDSKFSFNWLNIGMAQLADRTGETDLEMWCLVHPFTYAGLNSDAAANRMTDSSYSKGKYEEGSKAITYYTPSGTAKIVSYPYMKRGVSLVVDKDEYIRVGSTDLTMNKIFGKETDRFDPNQSIFENLPDNAGSQIKAYADCSPFYFRPSKSIVFTDIDDGV